MDGLRERDYYKERIIEMVKEIKNTKFIKMIYGFTQALYEEEEES